MPISLPEWPLYADIGAFLVAAATIVGLGTWMAGLADRLADRTGLGEAMVGAVLMGASTSLSGAVVSITAAWQGHTELAISNALGGIAAQTAFLGIADIVYQKANLEHVAASLANMLSGLLVIILLGGVLLAADSPPWTTLGVHPVTILLALAYGFGIRLVHLSKTEPMWEPRLTPETRLDTPAEAKSEESLAWMWTKFGALAALLAIAGWAIGQSGSGIAKKTALSETIVGGLLTAIATSTPELVTTIAAVRRGALTLAVGGILGGNAFDVLFVVGADVAYRQGSIYHAVGPHGRFLASLGIVMTGILVLGMLRRERRGVMNIGFESAAILVLYIAGFAVIAWSG